MTTSEKSKTKNAKSARSTDRITFLLFKDNKIARTLQFPLAWLHQLGITVLVLFLVTVASLTWAVKITLRIKSLHPERVQELEDKILALEGELKKAGVTVVAEASPIPLVPPTPLVLVKPEPSPMASVLAVAPAASPISSKSPTPAASAIPSPTASIVAAIASPSPTLAPARSPSPTLAMATPMPSIPPVNSIFFDLVPELNGKTPPDRATLSIEIDEPKARVKDRKLEVDFNIHYVGQDGSSQRGVILMIARGPGLLRAYPERLIRATSPQLQIGISKGEWFLVSRFRAVHGEFNNVASLDNVTSVEILLLDGDLNPLLHEKFNP